MGIPKYFRHIIRNYKELLHNVPNINIKPTHLYFDLNSIIHPCIQNIVENYPSLVKEYNDLEENDKKFNMDEKVITNFEIEFYKYFENQLINIINFVKPSKLIYLAIDGVAPRAKMEQQRIRRYRSVKEQQLKDEINIKYGIIKESWDRNAITPGTLFMYKLGIWMRKKLIKTIKKNNKKITIILDDSSVIGEGEHKIFDYIRKNNTIDDINTIYGLDADLIMLSLCNSSKIYLLRETQIFINKNYKNDNDSINSEYCYMDIDKFKEYINQIFIEKLRNNMTNDDDRDNFIEQQNIKLILYNYVFLCFIFGNDFLPKLFGFDLTDDNIEYILNVYIHQYSIIKKHIIDEDGYMNWFATKQLFLTLYGNEENRIRLYFKNVIGCTIRYNTNLDKEEKYENEIRNIENMPCYTINKQLYKFQDNTILHDWMDTYYKYYFNIISINKNRIYLYNLCNNYIDGLQWTIEYYIKGCPSYKWYYMYRATPCLREICNFLSDRFHYPDFQKGYYSPLIQLSMVLPISSSKLLPKGYRSIMNNMNLRKYYPDEYEIDTLFKFKLHECSPILMNIEEDDIINTYIELDKNKKLLKLDKKRDEIGELYII